MAKHSVALTEPTFIHGVLRPAGFIVEVDETDLGTKLGATAKPAAAPSSDVSLTPNLTKVGRGSADDVIPYEVAAVSPTGPSPTAPQALPPQTIEGAPGAFVAPAEPDGDSAGVAVIPEGGEKADQASGRKSRN